ncbi:TPA: hypothetical protein DIC20_01355 [Candidatus Dependentiae bacterium]|nr:MAG: hypothetical protein US03_C0002G0121 [candidate division TM6 bacterium GW2011_GWF2_36_131]KKQ03554.1 MAG: hypothetical protein US13_C0002G0120 [candidate division TM6 bacterium GW2011_GWE2_36_25]KKQ20171.1 MAG: hypothetical protein US32_C0001G0068 [candidate division TM6 bacterium GW2011_GWA2_36_9]HBR70712.1 hypothetical protein [Candidatus Dependentiae bacterium]HCU00332.1 hypothetical protein [Candidatus Dependentiae bacterium]
MKKILLVLFILLNTLTQDRRPSFPFITGDGFRSLAQHILDEESKFEPTIVNEKDIIFVGTHFLPLFFSDYFPQITVPFILINHNSDCGVSSNFTSYINDTKIIKWFAQNVSNWRHPKLIPIPIGLENRYNKIGSQFENIKIFISQNAQNKKRNIFIYANISETHLERFEVYKTLALKPYITWSTRKDFFSYLTDLSKSIFVLSPRGNGLDCHRTWEALLLGAIPIVKASSLDPIYHNLPVVIVKNWEELSKEFIEQKLEELSHCAFSMEKIYFGYWKNLIQTSQGV